MLFKYFWRAVGASICETITTIARVRVGGSVDGIAACRRTDRSRFSHIDWRSAQLEADCSCRRRVKPIRKEEDGEMGHGIAKHVACFTISCSLTVTGRHRAVEYQRVGRFYSRHSRVRTAGLLITTAAGQRRPTPSSTFAVGPVCLCAIRIRRRKSSAVLCKLILKINLSISVITSLYSEVIKLQTLQTHHHRTNSGSLQNDLTITQYRHTVVVRDLMLALSWLAAIVQSGCRS